MFYKSFFLSICILSVFIFLPSCAAQTEAGAPAESIARPSDTLSAPTATKLSPTNTLFPPTATSEPSAISTQPPTKAPPTLHCEGEGSPVIILIHGCGSPDPLYRENNFYDDLSKITQTCSYVRDRATTASPNTLRDIVNDLNTRITNAQLFAPYVLVGHSCGGWISILYAATYPEEIVGVVLLDTPHPDYLSRSLDIVPTAYPDEPVSLTVYRQGIIDSWSPDSLWPDNWDLGTNLDQVRTVTSLVDIPLLVLSADAQQGSGSGSPEIAQRMTDDWIAQHKELAALSTNGSQVTVENTGHLMWGGNPTKIISLIRSFIQQVRSTSP